MKTISKSKKSIYTTIFNAVLFAVAISLTSCDPTIDSLEFDLPEANSQADLTPPSASFSSSVTDDFLTYTFGNTSSSATTYAWDFGDGNTSAELDGENTYPDEGTYIITLVASDALGVTSTFSDTIEVVEPEAPLAITPEILNGNFDDGQDNWKIASFSGGTTSPYNSSSDGSPINYDGSDSGESKTPGAKWTSDTSIDNSNSSKRRYAYQAITVTPNTEYIIEFAHAIKTDNTDIDGGDRVLVEILDGQFSEGTDAVASSNSGALAQIIGDTANGKADFKVTTKTFTSNASGEISIWIYALTRDELYVDNVKVYPAE